MENVVIENSANFIFLEHIKKEVTRFSLGIFPYPGKNASFFRLKMLAKKRSTFPWVGKNAQGKIVPFST